MAQYPVPGEKPKYAGSKSGQGWSNRGIVRTSTSEIWAVLETKNPIQKGSCAVQETPLEEFNDYRNAMAMKATIQFLSNTTMNAPFFIAQVSAAACRRLFSPGWTVTPVALCVAGFPQASRKIAMLSRSVAPPVSLILNASLSQIPCLHRPAFSSSCHLCHPGLSLAIFAGGVGTGTSTRSSLTSTTRTTRSPIRPRRAGGSRRTFR